MKTVSKAELQNATALDPVHQLLYDASQIMRKRGIAKHILEDDNGGVCVEGALYVAAGSKYPHHKFKNHDHNMAINLLREFLSKSTKSYWAHPAMWNNCPDRTTEQAAEALEGAALA